MISLEDLEAARQESEETGARLSYILIAKDYLSEADVTSVISSEYHLPSVDLSEVEVDERAVAMIPSDFASKHALLPIKRSGRTLTVALADPSDPTLVDVLKFITRLDIELLVAGEVSLRSLIEKHYDVSTAKLGELLDELEELEIELVEEEQEQVSTEQLRAQVDDAPVVRLINGVLTDAVKRGASDIHIEPYEKQLRVRYRIDGALQEIMLPPLRMQAALISRVKILADLNIAERRIPQDGRIKMKLGKRVIDFRVSTLPTLPRTVRYGAEGRAGHAQRDRQPVWHGARDRTDRFRKDDDPLQCSHPDQHGRGQHHDRRGSGGVQPERYQPGTDSTRDRAHLRGRSSGLPAPGSQHRHGR
jgi:type IV pilus assembly protein PilB